MTRIAGLLGALLIMAGCAALAPERSVHPAAVASAADTNIQCYKQRVTGSVIATPLCTTRAQRDGIDAKDFLTNQVVGGSWNTGVQVKMRAIPISPGGVDAAPDQHPVLGTLAELGRRPYLDDAKALSAG